MILFNSFVVGWETEWSTYSTWTNPTIEVQLLLNGFRLCEFSVGLYDEHRTLHMRDVLWRELRLILHNRNSVQSTDDT